MHANELLLHMDTTSPLNNKLIFVTANYEGDVSKQHRLKVCVLDHNHNPGLISPVYNLFNAHPLASR